MATANRDEAARATSPADWRAARESVIDHARRMNALGLNQGRSGNVSVRAPGRGGFLVTASGVPYQSMVPEDVVLVTWDGAYQAESPGRRPSTEWRLHRDIYQSRPDAGAVVHAHAMFATTLACLERGIPAFHYMVAVAGGTDIRCAPYATFGTQALSDHALAALAGRRACLHGHHGMTVFAESLEGALALAVEVETLAAMYWRAIQVGEPRLLPEAEMAVVLDGFKSYGKADP